MEREPVDPNHLRKLPSHFAWADHRLREHLIKLTLEEIALYFFLHLAADRDGLSYYSDHGLGKRLGLTESQVATARIGLGEKGRILYRYPLYQILPVEDPSDETGGTQEGGSR